MPKYKKLQNGPIKLRTKTLDFNKLPKATNIVKALKYQMRIHIYQETINVFLKHLDWVIQPFQLYSGKFPSPIEWLLNPGNRGEIKKKRLCLLSFATFFCIILFGPSCSRSYINNPMSSKNRITSE